MDFTNYLTMRSSNLATMRAAHLSLSTLTGSTLSLTTHITAPMAIYSTMMGSSITVSTLTGSTLFGSTMLMSSIQTSFLTLSTLTVSSINGALPGTGTGNALTTSTLAMSTLTVSTINFASTIISLGQSTNQTYNNFSNGSFAAGSWITAKSAMSAANKTVQSANGLYQLVVANATSGLFLSSDSGITWSILSGGLPTLTGSAYWSDGAISANGQYITLSIYGGSLWMSADYGRTFALTNQPTPNIWLPLNGNTTDSMGLSVVTTPGTVPGYVTLNYPGYTAQAVNLLNTAGSTATRYIRGTWTVPSNFTVSGWFNPQTLTGVHQIIFSTFSSYFAIFINPSNQFVAIIPSGGSTANVSVASSSTLIVNTWYYFSLSFQTNGVCSLYLNNTLLGSVLNTQGVGSLTTSAFELSGYDNNQTSAFNGYINNLRITNSVSTYVPIPLLQPNIWMPFENSTADLGSNAITPIITGSVSYVPGVVGLNAVNFANTAGGTGTNYIRGACSPGTNFTVSLWFNLQVYPNVSSNSTKIVTLGNTTDGFFNIDITAAGLLRIMTYRTGGIVDSYTISTISTNTWYNIYLIFQQNGSSLAYLNGVQTTSYTGPTLFSTITTMYIGANHAATQAFNGYVDDFRIYNAVIPYHTLVPQNYRSLALSGTGQYALASAASGWVVGSSNAGQTWSKQAVSIGTQGNLIQPNKTSLAQSTWEQAGVNWTASASSYVNNTYLPYSAFDNRSTNVTTPFGWNAASYSTSTGIYTGSTSTNILGGVGTQLGEWLQIQSSVPLILSSYTFSAGDVYQQMVKSYYIVGSMDNLNWYPLQYCNMPSNAFNSNFQSATSYLTVNISGLQSFIAGISVNAQTTAYSTSTTPYLYFRIICNSIFSGAPYTGVTIGEFYLNFTRPSTQSLAINHTGQHQLVATGPAAGSVMPQLSGLAASTWTQGGVNWMASGNVEYFPAYRAFNNLNASDADKWETLGAYTGGSFSYGGTTTTSIQTIGSVGGDWLQIQSSVPLVLTSYSIGANDTIGRSPKTYYIVGSNDGSTWYPIQYCNFATIPFTATFTTTSYITVNFSGTQSITAGQTASATTITYTFTTNAYTYFRMVTTHLFSQILINIGEWNMNFSNSVSYSSNYGSTWLNTSSTVSNESVALSPSGQYTLSTNSVLPLARLTFDNTNADSQSVLAAPTVVGTPGYSTSIKTVGTHSVQFANATVGGTPTVYLNYTLPAVLNKPSMLTMSFWMYPTGYAATSYVITLTNGTQLGPYFYFRSSGVGLTFNINGGANQSAEYAQAPPLNAWTHLAFTFTGSLLSFYMNGVLLGTMSSSGSLTLTNGGNITNLFVGTLVASSGAFAGYVDDVRIYTSALNSHEVAALYNNPALTQTVAVSNSYLPITSYTKPVLPGITANVVDSAVSQTGQYMVAVTSSTTNNVYYSTDYGVTFTALTIGSTAMVSCSISYDGSYLTVESATTVHTLNRNTRGFSVTVGNQAGLVNQAQNAIAIGNQAGKTNQSANSIVLNATGNALDAVAPGFYVAPIATTTGSSATSFGILGYGTDNQVVQSSALTVLQNGLVGINSTVPGATLDVNGTISTNGTFTKNGTTGGYNMTITGGTSSNSPYLEFWAAGTRRCYIGDATTAAMTIAAENGASLNFLTSNSNRMVITSGGTVGIGTTTTQSDYTLTIRGTGASGQNGQLACYKDSNMTLALYANSPLGAGWSGVASILYVTRDTTTSRSINMAGTINASGNDYAEYMVKNGDFIVSKGDIVGVDKTGLLTNQYDEAITFVVKSTDPSYVGGDSWGTEERFGVKPTAPETSASEEEKAAYQAAKETWEAALEVERQRVDRIAFSGRVPVNILGAQPGDYIVPTRNVNGTIGGQVITDANITFSEYKRAVGKVIDILLDGRATIIVKVC